MTTKPGDGVALHVHDRDEELYYVLEGVYEFWAGGERFSARPGSLVVIPPHVPHSFRNRGSLVARALMIFRPGGFDKMLLEIRQAGAAEPVDEPRWRAIQAKWGITFLDQEP